MCVKYALVCCDMLSVLFVGSLLYGCCILCLKGSFWTKGMKASFVLS